MREPLQKYIDAGILYILVKTFCRMIGYSTPTYYKLRATGLMPKETSVLGTNRPRIAIEEIDRWMTELENPSPAKRIRDRQAESRGEAAIGHQHCQRARRRGVAHGEAPGEKGTSGE